MVESLPTGEWLRALMFMGVGCTVIWLLAPRAGSAPGGVSAILLVAALAMTSVGLWYAVRTRGDSAVFAAGTREATLRSLGLLPSRRQRVVAIDDIEEVLVNVRGNTGGGARWRPVLRAAGEEIPLSRVWYAERGACEQVARELREWLAGQGVKGPRRAAEDGA